MVIERPTAVVVAARLQPIPRAGDHGVVHGGQEVAITASAPVANRHQTWLARQPDDQRRTGAEPVEDGDSVRVGTGRPAGSVVVVLEAEVSQGHPQIQQPTAVLVRQASDVVALPLQPGLQRGRRLGVAPRTPGLAVFRKRPCRRSVAGRSRPAALPSGT